MIRFVKEVGRNFNQEAPTAGPGSGTVTSVAMTVPSGVFSITGSPITSSGTLAVGLINQLANTIWAGPVSGAENVPTFRLLVSDDIPNLSASKITSGTLGVARGGTGATTLTGILVGNGTSAFTGIASTTANQMLRVNSAGTAYEWFSPDYLSNPMTSLGDMIYGNAAGAALRRSGNTTTTKMFLSQTGDGTSSAAPQWETAVTSVALTMPSAFAVGGSPITTTGTLAVTATGDTTQYIAGDGSLVAFPITGQAGTLVREVRNNTGATLTKGTVVYINGALGNKPTVAKALATSDATSAQTFGLIQADIPNNSNGYLVAFGDLDGLNTSSFTEGVQLYLSSTTAGGYTITKQYAPNHLVYIGVVTRSHPTQGRIEVRIQNGYEMDELHDVVAQTPSNNDGLFYNTSNSLWESKSIATALGFTPVTSARTLTINGTAYDLSADRTWSVGTITSLTGEATASGTGAVAVTLTNSAVIGKVLTGLSVSGGTIASTDSILTAFGKLQNQVNGLVGGVMYQGTWNASTNTPTLTSSVGTKGHYYVVSVAGSTNLNGVTDWKLGDWAIFNGSTWEKVDNTDSVVSVNGYTGAVSLTTADISEVTNLYYTDARARAAITLTTSESSGASTYSGGTLNIPNYTLSGLGGVPSTRTITINGTSFDLSADRSYSVGTVTSVALSVPTGLSVTGSPITSSGTLAIALQSGYSIPTTSSQTNWDAAYNDKINSAAVTGTTTKTLTLTQQDGGTITASWTDINTDAVTSVFGRTGAVVAQSGDYTTAQVTESGNLYYLDSRARASLSFVAGSGAYNSTTGVITIPTNTNQLTNGANYITLTSLSGGSGISYNNTTGVITSTITQYTDALARAAISETVVGLDYNNTTGVFSTTSGYGIPTTASQTNWDTAYTNRITSLTTTGSSGAATLTSNTLNIPNYTLSGLGGVPTTRTITINDVTFDLSANRSWSVGDFGTW